jgi:hypothetical protein
LPKRGIGEGKLPTRLHEHRKLFGFIDSLFDGTEVLL